MAKFKIGQRVVVLPGVSNCRDAGSLQHSARLGKPEEGVSRTHFVGVKGEVVQIGADGPCICPDANMILVDDQIKQGKPQGSCTMREWYLESELEHG